MMRLPKVSVIPSLRFASVPGRRYMTERETRILLTLIESVKPKIMIEFGVNDGCFAELVLKFFPDIEQYFGVDVDKDYQFEIAAQRSELPQQPGQFAQADSRFQLVLKPRGTFDAELPNADLIFIDGDHGYHAVLHDSELAYDLINDDGMIIWHDYGNTTVQVTAALDSLYSNGWALQAIEATWLVFEKGAI